MARGQIATYEPDLFSDDGILKPIAHYSAMRELGPVVYLPKADCFAVTRFDECREVLRSPDRFISGRGIALNAVMNENRASVITSDGPRHAFMRKLEGEPLAPKAVLALRTRINNEAERLLDDLLSHGEVWHDTVKKIACYLPLTVVMELGGLPPAGRAEMLRWAAAAFDLLGPMNARAVQSLPTLKEFLSFMVKDIDRDSVTAGSWAARAFDLAEDKVIPPEMVATILTDFVAPSLDTTIAGISNLLMLLGQNREQWERLKTNPGKIPNAVNESLRLGAPIRCFGRVVPRDTELGGVLLPADSTVAVFFASGNRDEAKFPEADRFDIARSNAVEHLGFGTGPHQCLGANLARLEMTAILSAMLDRVDHFEVGKPVYSANNLLRTLESLPIRLHRRSK